MAHILEIFIWGIGFSLLHEGVARRVRKINIQFAVIAIASGALILLGGSALWHLSAKSFVRLSETQQIALISRETTQASEDVNSVSLQMRIESSIRLAKAAFASGEEGVKVLSKDGEWIPFAPDSEDLIAREAQLELVDRINKQRQELIFSARIAEQESFRWLISAFLAICTGLLTALLYPPSSRQ